MSLETLTQTAVGWCKTGTSVMVSGCHGCGKTEWVTNTLAPALGIKRVVTFHPSHAADQGDLTGLPDKHVREDGTVVTKFAPPDWMVQNEPVLMFIDEANRGLQIVQAALMEFTCNHRYNDIQLPEGSAMVAAINPEGADYEVGHLDFAQKDRYWLGQFNPTVDDTLMYFAKQKVNQRIIQFLTDNPSMLDYDHFTNKELLEAALNTGLGVTPSCRGWERFHRFLAWAEQEAGGQNCYTDEKWRNIILTAAEGKLGTNIALAFKDYMTVLTEVLTAEKIFTRDWTSDYSKSIQEMDNAKSTILVKDMRLWCVSHEEAMKKDKDMLKRVSDNWYNVLKNLKPDCMMASFTTEINPMVNERSADRNAHKWLHDVLVTKPELRAMIIEAVTAAAAANE